MGVDQTSDVFAFDNRWSLTFRYVSLVAAYVLRCFFATFLSICRHDGVMESVIYLDEHVNIV